MTSNRGHSFEKTPSFGHFMHCMGFLSSCVVVLRKRARAQSLSLHIKRSLNIRIPYKISTLKRGRRTKLAAISSFFKIES